MDEFQTAEESSFVVDEISNIIKSQSKVPLVVMPTSTTK
uniref:MGC85297 protein n=1 Tax=Xenopus laevis TaxID=8355 RepID=Q66KZ4_XENLA|nr:MGC85297 protein [Xenopus laevis]